MFLQEIRHAIRVLAGSPAFTAVAALSLALGIGANSAIFSLADALLLRPLPIHDPSRVVNISSDSPTNPFEGLSYPDYRDLCAKARSFDGIVASDIFTFGFAKSANAIPQMRLGGGVSGNFFKVMGVTPILGRDFLPEETRAPGHDNVA